MSISHNIGTNAQKFGFCSINAISMSSRGQNGSSTTFNPADIGNSVIDTVTAINAGGRIGSHHFSCTSDGGIKMDIWNATATTFAEEWMTSFEIPVDPLVYAPNTGLSGFLSAI